MPCARLWLWSRHEPGIGPGRKASELMARISYNGTSYRTVGDLPAVGSRAPDLSLVNVQLQDVTLANWFGKRKVLNIFPSIDAEKSARSVIVFDRLASGTNDSAMLMVSCDLPFAFERFGREHSIGQSVGLSALRHAGFGKNYGVEILEGPLKGLFSRAVLVLDENDTVVYGEQIADVNDEPDYAEVCAALGIKCDLG